MVLDRLHAIHKDTKNVIAVNLVFGAKHRARPPLL